MRDFKKPDLNAPRFRKKTLDILVRSFFKEFVTIYPQYKDIPQKVLKEKIRLINGYIWNTVIKERDGVELPNGLGCIFIGTCPRKKSDNTDYNTSARYEKHIQHRNTESDDYLGKIFYTNFEQKYHFKYHELWGFDPVRQFQRDMSQVYRTDYMKYIMIEPMFKVSRIFRKQSYKMLKKEEVKVLLESYNEFEGL